jgi:hypothetical protein
MATTTTNYGFEKPDVNEFYDVEVFNRNMDKADAKMEELDAKVDNASTMPDETTNAKYKFIMKDGRLYVRRVS